MITQTISSSGPHHAPQGRASRQPTRRASPTLSGSELRKIVADMLG